MNASSESGLWAATISRGRGVISQEEYISVYTGCSRKGWGKVLEETKRAVYPRIVEIGRAAFTESDWSSDVCSSDLEEVSYRRRSTSQFTRDAAGKGGERYWKKRKGRSIRGS